MGRIKNITLPDNTTYDIYGKNVQNITWSDYQNLTSEQKNSDTAYFITDVPDEEMNNGIVASIPNTPTAIATFNASALPMPSLSVGIEAVQAGSGDPSPTNVRPFTGWSAVNVYDTNKNMFDPSSIAQGTYDNSTNVWRISPPALDKAFNFVFKPNTRYTFSGKAKQSVENKNMRFVLFYTDGSYDNLWATNLTDEITFAVTSAEGKTISSVTVRYSSYGGVLTVTDFQIEIGTSASQYVAPNGQTYTTTLKDGQGNPIICYGGTLTNENGVQTLVNDHEKNSLIGSAVVVTDADGYAIIPLGDMGYVDGDKWAMCNMLKKWDGTASTIPVGYFKVFNSPAFNRAQFIFNLGYSSGTLQEQIQKYANFLDSMVSAGTPLEVIYGITAPQQIPQDNLPIASQSGTNNLWADSGKVLSGEYVLPNNTQLRMNDKVISSSSIIGHAISADFASNSEYSNRTHFAKTTRGMTRATLDSTSTSTNFKLTADEVDELYDGLTVFFTNTVVAGASGLKINLNNTGNKSVWASAQTGAKYGFSLNTDWIIYYDAINDRWVAYEGIYTKNTNTIGEYAGGCKAGTNGLAKYCLFMRTGDDTWESLVTTSGTGTSKTKNTSGFILGSEVLYQDQASYTSGSIVPQAGAWCTTSFDTRYSTNGGKFSSNGKPFLIKGTISNDRFYLANTWWTNTYPSTEDGFYYIYVGQMYNTYQATLYPTHPIYYYTDGKLRTYIPGMAIGNSPTFTVSDGLLEITYNS